jgi:hypothetical protein
MTDGDLASRLAPHHLAALREGSAISEPVILARGYRTITEAGELESYGFAPSQRRAPGLLIPTYTTDGKPGPFVFRPDCPRSLDDRRKGRLPDGTFQQRVIKYEWPKGAAMRVDCPPACRPALGEPSVPLWITEGCKKADALASIGLCAIALQGVWNFKGRNGFGGTTVLADFDHITWPGRDVRIVFDSDLRTKTPVRQALERLTAILRNRGARVAAVYLPQSADGHKQGVDDWLAAGHGRQELEGLAEAPRPRPQPAAPQVRLLNDPPHTLARPLAILGDRAYAATWLWVEVTYCETMDKNGVITRHAPPLVVTEQRLFVVRDDGKVFGDGGDAPLDDLNLIVHLSEIPPHELLWSAEGVTGYRAGNRPDPVDVFLRVCANIDRFVDFDRSLACQETMAELVACYVIATYCLDAFSVIGFIWANGDRGAGKTGLIALIARHAYLGQLIISGGSFASLRDMADYGATLAFDDAESLSDDKKADPDKRNLLLAGNRRGSTVPVKELGPDKCWHIRHVNSFCARLFSATQMADPILASRSIVVPLIRTTDRSRANAVPEDTDTWPHPRRPLIDDLWALALANVRAIKPFESWVNSHARLVGRNLEPWRAILAVAAWLDEQDKGGRLRRSASGQQAAVGLFGRLEQLSCDYQEERRNLEKRDLTAYVILGLCHCATSATSATNARPGAPELSWIFTVAQVKQAILDQSPDDEMRPEWVSSTRIGLILGKLRLQQEPRPGGKGSRPWRVTLADLVRLTTAYGLKLPQELTDLATVSGAHDAGGTGGTPGTGGTDCSEHGSPRQEAFEL